MDNSTGAAGESFIADVLKKKGYKLLDRNYKTRFGEIDIIVSDKKYIVFVEVKTRAKGGLTSPFESVTPSKQKKIILAAQSYLLRNKVNLQPRFDVAAVYTEDKKIVAYDYLTDAFQT